MYYYLTIKLLSIFRGVLYYVCMDFCCINTNNDVWSNILTFITYFIQDTP